MDLNESEREGRGRVCARVQSLVRARLHLYALDHIALDHTSCTVLGTRFDHTSNVDPDLNACLTTLAQARILTTHQPPVDRTCETPLTTPRRSCTARTGISHIDNSFDHAFDRACDHTFDRAFDLTSAGVSPEKGFAPCTIRPGWRVGSSEYGSPAST